MKTYLLLISLLFGKLNVAFSQSPSIVWQKCFGGSHEEDAYSIVKTFDGGYIIGGWAQSNDSNVSGNHGGFTQMDYWIVKIDSLANIQWQKCYGGSSSDWAQSIIQTIDSCYVIAGISGSNDFDVTGNHGMSDVWVLKIDAVGNILWQNNFGGSYHDIAYSIKQTNDFGFVLAGYTESSDGDVSFNHGGSDFWVIKLNAFGNLQWQKCYGGSQAEIAQSIDVLNDGNYIVGGFTNSFDGDVTGLHGNYDYWIVKIDTSGNILWQKCLGGTSEDILNSIKETTDNGFILGGNTNSNDGDVAGLHDSINNFYTDYWVVKLDSIGDIQWQKCFGGSYFEYANCIIQSNQGEYLVAGRTHSNDGDVFGINGVVEFQSDFWIVDLDSTGNLNWQKCLGGTIGDEARAIVQAGDSSFVIAGMTASNDGNVSGNHGQTDYWIVKLSTDTITGIAQLTNNNSQFSIYPNPSNSILTVSFNKTKNITITNLLGEIVLQKTAQGKVELDVSFLSAGIYFIKTGNESRKFVKE